MPCVSVAIQLLIACYHFYIFYKESSEVLVLVDFLIEIIIDGQNVWLLLINCLVTLTVLIV